MDTVQEATKSSYYLWQLYHSQVEATAAEHELEGQQEELRETAKLLKEREAAVKEKKKEIAGLNKSRTLMEQKAKKRRTEADKNVRLPMSNSRLCVCLR